MYPEDGKALLKAWIGFDLTNWLRGHVALNRQAIRDQARVPGDYFEAMVNTITLPKR